MTTTHETYFRLIWPEKRIVSERQIQIWFGDALANGDVELDEGETAPSPHDMAKALDDAGLITLGRME